MYTVYVIALKKNCAWLQTNANEYLQFPLIYGSNFISGVDEVRKEQAAFKASII